MSQRSFPHTAEVRTSVERGAGHFIKGDILWKSHFSSILPHILGHLGVYQATNGVRRPLKRQSSRFLVSSITSSVKRECAFRAPFQFPSTLLRDGVGIWILHSPTWTSHSQTPAATSSFKLLLSRRYFTSKHRSFLNYGWWEPQNLLSCWLQWPAHFAALHTSLRGHPATLLFLMKSTL